MSASWIHRFSSRRPLLVSALGLVLLGVPIQASAQNRKDPPIGIVAIVNGEPITYGQLERELRQRMARLQIPADAVEETRETLLRRVLDDMIFRKLLLQRCDQEKIDVNAEEVQRWVQQEVQRQQEKGANIKDVEEYFQGLQEATGEDEKELRRRIQSDLRIGRLFRRLVYKEEFITPQELRAHYESHPEQFTTDDQYKFRHLFVPRGSSDVELEQIVEEIEKRIAAGENFVELIRIYSRGPYRDEGGLYERTDEQLSQMLDEISTAVRQLKPGEISERVLSGIGVHFFRLEERVSGERLDFEKAQDRIRVTLAQERRRQQQARFEKELRERAFLRVFLEPAK